MEAIAYDRNGVTVTTNQGDFSAQRVIVTLPLGVLKKGDVQFTPALPPEKVAAIASLGMGVLIRVLSDVPHSVLAGGVRLAGVFVGSRRGGGPNGSAWIASSSIPSCWASMPSHSGRAKSKRIRMNRS